MIQVPALKIQQNDVTLLVTALPLSELRKRAKVDYWQPDNPDGYQRPMVDRRLADVAKYVQENDSLLPTSILVCVRDGDLNQPTFVSHEQVDGFAEMGTLNIPEEANLWVVDGQHRSFGVARAYERDGAANLADYPFPVTVMLGVDRYTEMLHFSTINTQQRKMPTDIVDRHLVQRAEHEGHLGMVTRSGMRGERQYLRAKCTRITDSLDEMEGPWYHQISVPGVEGKDRGLIRQHAMVASLEPAIKDPVLVTLSLSEEETTELLASYWRSMAEVWPEAFTAPKEHRVQATVGVYSLNMVFPTMVQYCLAERNFSQDHMRQLWEGATQVDSQFWHKQDGSPYTLGTGMASIRALAAYLRSQLPRPTTFGL